MNIFTKQIKLPMKRIKNSINNSINNKGMEMVQVAILVAIAIALGLIFRSEITAFIDKTFVQLNGGF